MNTSMLKGALLGGLATVLVGAGAVTGYRTLGPPSRAEVLAVKDVYRSVKTPEQRCDNVTVRRQAPVQDEQRVAGTVLGGVAGGLLGSQVGGGNGKRLATVAGAVAGGYAGNQVQKGLQQRDTVSTTERRCRTVTQTTSTLVGYDVTVRHRGTEQVVRTSFKPGPTLPVKDGLVVTTPPAP